MRWGLSKELLRIGMHAHLGTAMRSQVVLLFTPQAFSYHLFEMPNKSGAFQIPGL